MNRSQKQEGTRARDLGNRAVPEPCIRPAGAIFSLRTFHFDLLKDFYTKLLGEPERVGPPKWATFRLPGCRLILWPVSGREVRPGNGLQLCLQVESLDRALSELAALVPLPSVHEAGHGRELFFSDPDGNEVIVYEPNR